MSQQFSGLYVISHSSSRLILLILSPASESILCGKGEKKLFVKSVSVYVCLWVCF